MGFSERPWLFFTSQVDCQFYKPFCKTNLGHCCHDITSCVVDNLKTEMSILKLKDIYAFLLPSKELYSFMQLKKIQTLDTIKYVILEEILDSGYKQSYCTFVFYLLKVMVQHSRKFSRNGGYAESFRKFQ
ncbi:hypothetical protein Gasu2_16430 [Galdieria sulphuraria]|uniref:Uncharacterized protein n=1 Tax=Galdieria sulphuraria TaxID=130081 RepID=M2VY28_GALSU|nr:uncharacterized protein Gasu_43740 [Galdieria sulphuraria]EME28211.1 hypothetical protein Gasu_43740 [Galdieria sulphuraria]GJD07275.1 hypothetical protein Gasu2_16430 [Galdieria sulphuraria]|eukprot:XP_005704731.1 hypothetical protein Gasu_43740 [Galdieria sulphuraria]